jgi:hypothetical protein
MNTMNVSETRNHMTKTQSLVALYKGIMAAMVAQGATKITRPEVFAERQKIWATLGYGQNRMVAIDSQALTEATRALGGQEKFRVGPTGKRSKITFVFG